MFCVSEPLMGSVWQQVGGMRADQIQAMQKRHQRVQKTLPRFAYPRLFELREDAAGVGLFVFHVVLQAFLKASPGLKKVRRAAIDRLWACPPDELATLAQAAEPHVATYLREALYEEDDDVTLAENERDHCAHVINLAIVCLHQS